MNKRPIKTVLLISNDPEEARKIGEMFNDQGSYSFALTCMEGVADAEAYFATHSVDVVLLDLVLLDSPGLEKLLRTHPAGALRLCCYAN
jgi:DNA-binding response OmpR family regulator